MAKIDNDMPIITLQSIAEILNAKVRNLKTYEEKGLLPARDEEKKLYSINDIKQIELVHYLASIKKINAQGIRQILEIMSLYLDADQRDELLEKAGLELEKGDNMNKEILEEF